MGVRLLNRFLKDNTFNCIQQYSLEHYRGKRIVIDANIYMYRYIGDNALIENYYLLCSLFRSFGIIPLFIFDGTPPEQKKDELKERSNSKKKAKEDIKNIENKIQQCNNDEEKKKLEQLYSCEIYNESELKKYKEEARQFIINKKLDNLKNNFVIEFTPVGNVLMKYDKDCETFKFYSDKIVPYTYLEVVGRKFVKLFNCRPIFVDMGEELKLAEEKWEKTKVEKEENDKRIKEESIKNKTNLQEKKKKKKKILNETL